MRESVERAADVCPVEVAIAVLGGSWKMTIVKNLTERTHRFGELGRAVGSVTPRVLARQLRELEADGIVVRTAYPQVPPKVEYSLTPLGETLAPMVRALNDWGRDYLEQSAAVADVSPT
jgi:DNA-binding HxlR family transcriptional regulator